MISSATQRVIFRWIHIIFAIPILGYIARLTKFQSMPLQLVLCSFL